MSLEVRELILGEGKEAKAARELAKTIRLTAPKDIAGQLFVASSVRLLGYNTQDIDILVYGKFHNYIPFNVNEHQTSPFSAESVIRESKSMTNGTLEKALVNWPKRLYVNQLCMAIELKDHHRTGVELHQGKLCVKYNGKLHDPLEQVFKQKFVLLEFLKKRNINTPVSGLVWFRNLSREEQNQLVKGTQLEGLFLTADISFDDLLRSSLRERPPQYDPKHDCFRNGYSAEIEVDQELRAFQELYESRKIEVGYLTRSKLETLSRKLLATQDYVAALNEKKTVLLRGRAGTGKTIKLLRIAIDLATEHAYRSVLLTYNHSLVSDIRRLMAFHGKDNDISEYVQVITLHRFFHNLLVGFELIGKDELILDKGNQVYLDKLRELSAIITGLGVERHQLQQLMRSNSELLIYDYVLVDEGQDWFTEERDLLRLLYGDGGFVVADAQDQLVRNGVHCDWSAGLSKSMVHRKPAERQSLRQKAGVVDFVNEFARLSDLEWHIDSNRQLPGGRIIIAKTISSLTIEKALVDIQADGCMPYDLIVATDLKSKEEWEQTIAPIPTIRIGNEASSLSYFDFLNRKGYERSHVSQEYSVSPLEARLMHYESLRGLESWILVAHEFDRHLKRREAQYRREATPIEFQYRLESDDERSRRYACQWAIIAMTRPVDTLIVHLSDISSEWSRLILEVARSLPDLVTYLD